MAWLRDLTHPCRHPACSSRATVELMNNRNATMGYYCTRHGKIAQKDLHARETAMTNLHSATRTWDVT